MQYSSQMAIKKTFFKLLKIFFLLLFPWNPTQTFSFTIAFFNEHFNSFFTCKVACVSQADPALCLSQPVAVVVLVVPVFMILNLKLFRETFVWVNIKGSH